MAITTPTLVEELPLARSGPWSVNNYENDGTTPVALKVAPGIGKALYLTQVVMSGATVDVAITLTDEDGTVLFGPIQMQADGGGILVKDWKYPLKLIDNKGLSATSGGQVAFTIYVEGFIGQAPITR